MDRWVVFAIISMVFAGCTSVIAKHGLRGITGELGIAIRTAFVSVLILLFAAVAVRRQDWGTVSRSNVLWLGLSGLTTAISWVFYYKALAEGNVATVALIDKGSFVVAVLLAWLWLAEPITWRVVLGGGLILAGLLIVARR